MSSPTSPSTPVLPDGIHRAVDVHEPKHDGEILLNQGDIVTDVKDLGNGWCLGKNLSQDSVGIFPSTCIVSLNEIPTHQQLIQSQNTATPVVINTNNKSSTSGKRMKNEDATGGAGKPPISSASGKIRGDSNWRARGKSSVDPRSQTGAFGGDSVDSELDPERLDHGEHVLTAAQYENYVPPRRAVFSFSPSDQLSPDSEVDSPEEGRSPNEEDMTSSPSHASGVDIHSRVDLDNISSSSYPPKRVAKPHMVVKPNNQGSQSAIPKRGSRSKMSATPERDLQCATPPVVRPLPQRGPQHPSPKLQHPRVEHRPKPTPPTRRASRGPTPPNQLALNRMNSADIYDDVDTGFREPVIRSRHGSATLLQDRSTSPILMREAHSGAHTLPNMAASSAEADRDNVMNETIRRTPCSIRKEFQFVAESNNKCHFYEDYRTLDLQPDLNTLDSVDKISISNARYKPIIKHQKVADSKGQPIGQHIYYRDGRPKRKSFRLILSLLGGLLFGFFVFLLMFFYLEYSFLISVITAAAIAIQLAILFALSRLCRCMGALMIPSICTTRGRISVLILMTGFLIGGPVKNIYLNMEEISRSMSCSAEQAYNQTMLLLAPFDSMMLQLDNTMGKLVESSHNVSVGLTPLEQGMARVETDIQNGHTQLLGTRMTCRRMVDQAYEECTEGITKAQDQCLEVIQKLGVVYLHARDVLDSINPEKWAGKQQHLFKRQIIANGGTLGDVPQGEVTEEDICEPLDTITVCQRLNDSSNLCMPSEWAGEIIQEAINQTQRAMKVLQKQLQFEVTPQPYYNSRGNMTRAVYQVRKEVQTEFESRTQYFDLVISIFKKLIPFGLVLLVYVCYLHIKLYNSKDSYDNLYITDKFKEMDYKRVEIGGATILPLKRYELNYLINTQTSDLSPPEDGLYRVGLCVLLLHVLVSFSCYVFDFILYWVLNLIYQYGSPDVDATGKLALENVVTGDGVIVKLLESFILGIHPGNSYGDSADAHECIPKPVTPSLIYLLVIIITYALLILTILLKAYMLRLRNAITGYFYPDRQKARTYHLYNIIVNQRMRMPRILRHRAKANQRESQLLQDVAFGNQMIAKCPPCRIFRYEHPVCLVCGNVADHTFHDCETEQCEGVYCGECFEDLGQACPLCLHELSDEEDDYEDVEGEQPYNRSSKIYL